jgi:AcrR family transcriptional regulator
MPPPPPDRDVTAAPSVWLRAERGSRGRPSQWTRSAVADAGIQIADTHGLDTVTMRSVATQLGTAAASLYRIVDSRDQLLELMADRVNGEFNYSTLTEGSGTDGLRILTRQARAIYANHAWLLDVHTTTLVLGPNAMTYLDHALGTLADTPLTSRERLETIGILSGLVRVLARDDTSKTRGRLSALWQVAMTEHLRAAATGGTHPHLEAALTRPDSAEATTDRFEEVVGVFIDTLVHGQRH